MQDNRPIPVGIKKPERAVNKRQGALNRRIISLACAAAMIPGLAAAGPALVDRYTTRWTKTGNFSLRFYGTLADGTVCPPGPNALPYSIDQEKREYVHAFAVSEDSDPKARALFKAETACLIAFSGKVSFNWHHAKTAIITAISASPIAERR